MANPPTHAYACSYHLHWLWLCAWQDGPVQDAQGRQGRAQDARLTRRLRGAAHQEPAHACLRRQ
eukprot:scaffold57926_cov69-Phaeocystis_antarctica.AAC.2